MKHKRVFFPESIGETDVWCNIFCYCTNCGTEIVGNEESFKEHNEAMARAMSYGDFKVLSSAAYDYVKENICCPVCGAPIQTYGNEVFLDLSLNKLIYDVQGQRRGNGSFLIFENGYGCLNCDFVSGYRLLFNGAKGTIDIYSEEDIESMPESEEEQLKWLTACEPKDENEITEIFECMRCVRIKKEEATVSGALEELMTESEAQALDTPKADISKIKKDPEVLKQYIEHLINIESSIYSTKERLEELLKLQIPVDEELSVAGFIASEAKREELEKAKKAHEHLPSEASYSSTQPKMPEAPKEPKEPIKPELKKAGLFNKRKVQEENDALTSAYEKKKQEYEAQQKAYAIALEEHKRALDAYKKEYSAWEKETEEKIKAAEKAAAQKVKEAEEALTVALKNPPETIETQEKKLLTAEIEQAKGTLRKLVKAKNELYALNVIFGKYRDIVALTSFYEYLLAGRCEALEGKDGAYNIYESEIRANQIISQLNDVMDSLEEIKNGQYLVYSTIKGVYSSLEQLNNKTEAALTAMDKMQGDISQISKQSEVIAYNTEQAAFYAKKNKELTDALGFMVALK